MDKTTTEPLIQVLKRTVEALRDRITALENRTIIEIECKSCDGQGETRDYYDPTPSKCYACSGVGHKFALSQLEEE